MKAMVYIQYGPKDVFQLEEMATPTPADNEVLIKVYAASVNPLDWKTMRVPFIVRLISLGLLTSKRKVLGCDIAGRVEAVGRHVRQLQPGDEVFGVKGFAGGGFAEYVCAIEDKLALKPTNVSFEHAAAAPVAAISALQGLRDKGRIQPGHKVGVWVHLQSKLLNRSGLKSLPCAAREMWTRRDRLARTMSSITRGKISLGADSVTI
jgi:NADPH:quinone reductase-like Zn-dependent oxidoreductase